MIPIQRGGFDCDGVLCNLHPAVFRRLQSDGYIPSGLKYDDYADCGWFEYDPETGKGIPGLTFDHIKSVCLDPQFWLTLPAYPYAAKVTNALTRLGAEIHIPTDRRWYHDLALDTECWAAYRDIAYHKVVVVHRNDKGKYAQDNNLDWFVEDTPANARLIAPFVDTVYLMCRPWNESGLTDLPNNCIVDTDTEICRLLIDRLETCQ